MPSTPSAPSPSHAPSPRGRIPSAQFSEGSPRHWSNESSESGHHTRPPQKSNLKQDSFNDKDKDDKRQEVKWSSSVAVSPSPPPSSSSLPADRATAHGHDDSIGAHDHHAEGTGDVEIRTERGPPPAQMSASLMSSSPDLPPVHVLTPPPVPVFATTSVSGQTPSSAAALRAATTGAPAPSSPHSSQRPPHAEQHQAAQGKSRPPAVMSPAAPVSGWRAAAAAAAAAAAGGRYLGEGGTPRRSPGGTPRRTGSGESQGSSHSGHRTAAGGTPDGKARGTPPMYPHKITASPAAAAASVIAPAASPVVARAMEGEGVGSVSMPTSGDVQASKASMPVRAHQPPRSSPPVLRFAGTRSPFMRSRQLLAPISIIAHRPHLEISAIPV